ncbi:uncharacterized protein LOC120495445 [Pimephales promelas]|uniref:uncharacterized protein LOC120495445 n=1 Tax=Pimephales promelas TaxID=90988 RepID=UPI0019556820|nr:uncharacterized protein LOC120495445 [Pimephales promelas]
MTIQIYLYLLIWSQAAEALTNQLTDLGENVTINCDLREKEVFWIFLKLLDSPVVIMRSFSNLSPFHFNERFTLKYSVHSKNNLFINNVTIDELGVYYCMSTDPVPKLSNATRLHIIQPTPLTECQNHIVEQCIQQNQTMVKYIQQNQTSWQTLTLVSALFNAVLVVVVIGHLKVCVVRRSVRRSAEQQLHNTDVQPTPDLQQHLDPNQLQHAEVDSSTLYTNIHPVRVNSGYVTLQLPK